MFAFCVLIFAQCAFVTHGLHWLSVYMMAYSVCIGFFNRHINCSVHFAWLSWTVACSSYVLLLWVALLLTHLALFWLPRAWWNYPVSMAGLCVSLAWWACILAGSASLYLLKCCFLCSVGMLLVHFEVDSLNLHLANPISVLDHSGCAKLSLMSHSGFLHTLWRISELCKIHSCKNLQAWHQWMPVHYDKVSLQFPRY